MIGRNIHTYIDTYMNVKVKSLSRVRLFATPRTVARQAPLSMGFSRQVSWSGWPLPSPYIRRQKLLSGSLSSPCLYVCVFLKYFLDVSLEGGYCIYLGNLHLTKPSTRYSSEVTTLLFKFLLEYS